MITRPWHIPNIKALGPVNIQQNYNCSYITQYKTDGPDWAPFDRRDIICREPFDDVTYQISKMQALWSLTKPF